MKKNAVFSVYAVGMHYWGGRELSIGEVYYLKAEPENPKDNHVIAIYSDSVSADTYVGAFI